MLKAGFDVSVEGEFFQIGRKRRQSLEVTIAAREKEGESGKICAGEDEVGRCTVNFWQFPRQQPQQFGWRGEEELKLQLKE